MDMDKLIGKINFLYNKSQNEGLTEEEKLEQKELRQQYIAIFKGNFKAQLDKVKRVPVEGNKVN
jgi:uncharacterized protein YnzC (UPF0291/DUF896 family)